MADKRIFEEYQPVDCEDCAHYWDDSCDGVPEGVERRCTAFHASRRVVLPAKIEALEEAVESLKTGIILLMMGLGILAVPIIVGLMK